MSKNINVREIRPSDLSTITEIYNHYIANTVITFELDPLSPEDMAERVKKVVSQDLFWLVAEQDGHILGYAYACEWSNRCAYRHTVETSVYLSNHHLGNGIGTLLYGELFERLERSAAHAILSGVALPNEASVALHEKFGMEKVAHFKETGFKFDRWIDVGYWQLLINPA